MSLHTHNEIGSADQPHDTNNEEKFKHEKQQDAENEVDDGTNDTDVSRETVQEKPSKYHSSRLYRILTPKKVRWDPSKPHPLGMGLTILYAISCTFTVANLYYCQPILNKIALTFSVTYEESAQVATLMQAGYAAGIIFILPIGDLIERRLFIISLVFFTATVWIGLCITPSFTAFRALSFICGASTVTPQLMIPLVGDFAAPQKKGFALSIVVSGLLAGMLVARFLAGVVTYYTSWRNIYWVACGAQYMLGMLLYVFMPDYPSTNPEGLNYFKALWSIPYMMGTEPVLIQSCLIIFFLSSVFTSFWTTLTFLFAEPPFNYSSLVIGLFSLLILVAMVVVPLYGRIIDRFVPHFSIFLGQLVVMIGCIIGTCIGTFTIAGPIIQSVGIDIGVQVTQVACRAAIFGINPKARNRVNTAYMASAFAGQLTGTAVGNRLYASGGWRWSSGFSIAYAGLSMFCLFARGPREKGWIGWKGSWRIRKDKPPAPLPSTEDIESKLKS